MLTKLLNAMLTANAHDHFNNNTRFFHLLPSPHNMHYVCNILCSHCTFFVLSSRNLYALYVVVSSMLLHCDELDHFPYETILYDLYTGMTKLNIVLDVTNLNELLIQMHSTTSNKLGCGFHQMDEFSLQIIIRKKIFKDIKMKAHLK